MMFDRGFLRDPAVKRVLATFPPAQMPNVEGRDCPVCPRTSWLSDVGPDGLRSFMCSAGHLLIVDAPERPCP